MEDDNWQWIYILEDRNWPEMKEFYTREMREDTEVISNER